MNGNLPDNNLFLKPPSGKVEDVPPQIFEDEATWHDKVYNDIIKVQNPELSGKIEEAQRLAIKLGVKDDGKNKT